jgi:hypothetical protein
MTNWQYFKWGAKNHPGTPVYLLLWALVLWATFCKVNGWILIFIVGFPLVALFYDSSIGVGKANKDLVEEEYK